MSDTLPPRPALDAWQAVSMRLTLFADAAELPLDTKGWWQVVVGEPPETTTEKPGLASRKDEGKFLGGTFSLEVKAHRISWEVQTSLNPETVGEQFPSLGPYPELRDQFVPAVSRWLPHGPRLTRVAFGCHLALPAEGRVASYRALGRYLPFRLDAEGARDFQYRINRPRSSRAISNVTINRLQTWSAVSIPLGLSLPNEPPVMNREHHASFLDLDINTVPQSGLLLVSESVPRLLGELVELATEIAEKGDRP